MEALLEEKRNRNSKTLGNNLAALLEPDPAYRKAMAEYFGELYRLRNLAVHGDILERETGVRGEARQLAADVLNSVICRRDYMIKGGYRAETPSDLLFELRGRQYKQGQPLGIMPPRCCYLWGKTLDSEESDDMDDEMLIQ